MIHSKKLSFIVFISCAIWILTGLFFCHVLPKWILKYGAASKNIELVYAKSKTNFFNSVTFSNVKISRPIKASLPQVKLAFRPWKFFSTSHVFFIDLEEPSVDIPANNTDKGLLEQPLKPIWVRMRLNINKGTIHAQLFGTSYSFNTVQGFFDLGPLGISGKITSEEENVGSLRGKFHIRSLDDEGFWSAVIEGTNLKLSEMNRFVIQNKPFEYPDVEGEFFAHASLSGSSVGKFRIQKALIGAESRSCLLKLNKNTEKIPFDFKIKISPQEVQIEKFKLDIGIEGSGVIRSPWKSPSYSLTIRSNEARIERFISLLPAKHPWERLEGKINSFTIVEGTRNKVVVSGQYNLDSSLSKIQLPAIQGSFKFSDGILYSSASIGGGTLTLEKKFAEKFEFNDIKLNISDFSLEKWAELNNWANVKGRLNSTLSWMSDQDNFSLFGHFTIDNLMWGRLKSPGAHQGTLDFDKTRIRIKTQNDSLSANAVILADSIQIDAFKMTTGGDSYFSGQGSIDIPSKRLRLSVEGKKIPPDLWPPLVAWYPEIEGQMDFSGDMNGTPGQIKTNLKLLFHDLKFHKNGHPWNGTTELATDDKFLTLKKIQIDGGYSGQLEWQANNNEKKGTWALSARLSNADPKLIRDVLKSTSEVSGLLNGNAEITWDSRHVLGGSSVTWKNGQWGAFIFDDVNFLTIFNDKSWKINQFVLIKDEKAIRASAEGAPLTEGWSYDASIQLQQWGSPPFLIDGEIQSSGKINRDYSVDGKISSPILWFQDNPIHGIEAAFGRRDKKWKIKGKGSENISFAASIDELSKKINGTINANALKLENLTLPLNLQSTYSKPPSGVLDIDAAFSGTLQHPEIILSGHLKDGRWENIPFDADTAFHIEPDSFTILPSNIYFRKGGTINITGFMDRTQAGDFLIKGSGTGIVLQDLMGLVGWTFNWEGKTGLHFEYKGINGHKFIDLRVDGRHSGLGPFKEEGTIHGRVSGDARELDFSGIRIESGNGYLKLTRGSSVFLDKTGAGKMRLNIESRNLSAGLLSIFGNAELTGSWAAKKENEDSTPRAVELDFFARSLWLNQYHLEGNVAHITMEKGRMIFSPIPGSGQQLSGEMIYSQYPNLQINNLRFIEEGVQKLFLNGLMGRSQWDFKMLLKEMDANFIGGVLNLPVSVSGRADVNATGQGNWEKPILSGTMTWRDGAINRIPLDFAEANFVLKNKILTVNNLFSHKKRGYQLKGELEWDLSEDPDQKLRKANIYVEKGDFSILKEVFSGVSNADGSFEGNLEIYPQGPNRIIAGRVRGEKINLQSDYTPNLKKGSFDVFVRNNKVLVHHATATLGNGIVALQGGIDLDNGKVNRYDLRLKSISKDGVLLKIPELAIPPGPVLGRLGALKKKLTGISRGEPTFDITLSGPGSTPVVSGAINLRNTVFTYPPLKLKSNKNEPSLVKKRMASFRDQIVWDLKLSAGSRTWYQNELVDAAVTGTLSIKGPKGNIAVDGKITTEQGSIVYSGNEFKIKEAILEIESPSGNLSTGDTDRKTLVYLKAMAEKEVYYADALSNNNQDTIIMKVDRSLIGEIQPRFYSKNNPNLSSEKAFQLAMGLPLNGTIEENLLLPDQRAEERKNSSEENDKLLRIGLVQLLDSSLASPLARALAQHTGLVDFIRVTYQERDPLSDTAEKENELTESGNITQNQFLKYAKGTKVKFGRGLSRRLFADYSFRVDEYQEKLDLRHEVELAYRLRQSFFLRGITELDSARTLGRPPDRRAILENQWRFGLPRIKKEKQADQHPENQ